MTIDPNKFTASQAERIIDSGEALVDAETTLNLAVGFFGLAVVSQDDTAIDAAAEAAFGAFAELLDAIEAAHETVLDVEIEQSQDEAA